MNLIKRNLVRFLIPVLAVGIMLGACLGFNAKTNTVLAAEEPTWAPINYVMADGVGKSMELYDIRTSLSYTDGKLTAAGSPAKGTGGMGVVYTPTVNLNGFNMNVSLNSYRTSGDRYFGLSFTDVGAVTDDYNEVPFYAKHSETWSNAYGAGFLFCVRPTTTNLGRALTVQFNYIGIQQTYTSADSGEIASNAGAYSDGILSWGRNWNSGIQLYDPDESPKDNPDAWVEKNNYDNIEIAVKQTNDGFVIDVNKGFWKKIDNITTDTAKLDDSVLSALGVTRGTQLNDEQIKRLTCGPAWSQSVISGATWGDSLYALSRFQTIASNAGKRLYARFFYKDKEIASDDSDEKASFTINTINGAPACTGNESDLVASKKVSGKVTATLTEDSLHAGVYPSTIESIELTDAPESAYNAAKTAILSVSKGNYYKVVNIKAKTTDGKYVSIINKLKMTVNLEDYKNAKLYRIVGDDVDDIDQGESISFTLKNSDTAYVIVYSGGGGCGSAIDVVPISVIIAIFAAALVVVVFKKLLSSIRKQD